MVVKEMERKGKGVVATRRILAGAVIFTEDPLVVVNRATTVLEEEFHRFQRMDGKLKEDFMSLYDPVVVDQKLKVWCGDTVDPAFVKFKRILSSNGVVIGVVSSDVGRSSSQLTGVYNLFSRINHSCSSNVVQNWKAESPLKIEVRAATSISKGEELTLNYLGGFPELCIREERQRLLLERWSFQCRCEVCSLSRMERDKNDMLRKFIIHNKDKVESIAMSRSHVSSALTTHLQVVVACYKIELEAKDILPYALSECHVLYQAVKTTGINWKCPKKVKENLKEKLGVNFMDVLGKVSMARAEILGSEMVEMVRKSLGEFSAP